MFLLILLLIGLLMSKKNFKREVGSVDVSLDFEIDHHDGQSNLAKFGYYFSKDGRCLSIETDKRVGRFKTQKAYELFGDALEEFIFFLLKKHYKLESKILSNSENITTQDTRIFWSKDWHKKDTLLLLIPGSGSVRAGQWARSICINDNLACGCMFPYISNAFKRNWGVFLFDPNGKSNGNRVYSEDHVIDSFDEYIEPLLKDSTKCNVKNILMVAHSAGNIFSIYFQYICGFVKYIY